MFDNNTIQIEDNLVKNLVRVFTAYGWNGKGTPDNYQTKYSTIKYGLYNGSAYGYYVHLSMILQSRRKDHNWGLYTSTFVEGVQTLLRHYSKRHGLFEIEEKHCEITSVPTPTANIFKTLDYAKDAIDRLESLGKTNIRYSLIEEYGEDRVRKDLRKVYPYAKLFISYDEHEPDQLRDWLYDDGVQKMTVMYPIMPLVYITLDN